MRPSGSHSQRPRPLHPSRGADQAPLAHLRSPPTDRPATTSEPRGSSSPRIPGSGPRALRPRYSPRGPETCPSFGSYQPPTPHSRRPQSSAPPAHSAPLAQRQGHPGGGALDTVSARQGGVEVAHHLPDRALIRALCLARPPREEREPDRHDPASHGTSRCREVSASSTSRGGGRGKLAVVAEIGQPLRPSAAPVRWSDAHSCAGRPDPRPHTFTARCTAVSCRWWRRLSPLAASRYALVTGKHPPPVPRRTSLKRSPAEHACHA
jgi:hypothetical protein